jgi:hypothetical protein
MTEDQAIATIRAALAKHIPRVTSNGGVDTWKQKGKEITVHRGTFSRTTITRFR